MVCSPPVFSIHEISQTRILEWVTISFSRGSSQPRDQTCISCICRWILYLSATREIAGSRHIAYWVQHFPQHHLSGSGIAQLEFYHCWEPAWGTPPLAKVMRKEAQHTQRRYRASGVRLEILEHLPPKLESAYFLLCAFTYTSDLTGAVPHYLSLKKELAYSSS